MLTCYGHSSRIPAPARWVPGRVAVAPPLSPPRRDLTARGTQGPWRNDPALCTDPGTRKPGAPPPRSPPPSLAQEGTLLESDTIPEALADSTAAATAYP